VGGMLSVEGGGNAPIPPALPRQPHTNKHDKGKKKAKEGIREIERDWQAQFSRYCWGLRWRENCCVRPKRCRKETRLRRECEQKQGKQETFRSWMSGIDLEVYERCVDVA
jgi:hypothetical protein